MRNIGGVSFGAGGLITDNDAFDAWCTEAAPVSPSAPLALAPCLACAEEGRTVAGYVYDPSTGSSIERYRCCAVCHGLAEVAVELGDLDLADLRALDLEADAALALSDREPGAVAAACDLVVAGAVGLASLLAAVVEAAVEAHRRADERDGESVAAAGRDPSALTSTSAPVVALRARRPVATSRAA